MIEKRSIKLSNRTDSQLTICSSVIAVDKPCIELNWWLVKEINTTNVWQWTVAVDNHEGPPAPKIVDLGDERCRIIHVYGDDIKAASAYGANYHHGAVLNKILNHIQTRFAVFLDPDFYIVRPEWIEEIIAYVSAHDLSFFGVPWHPRWYMKERYFPCVHCLFVDLQRVPVGTLNFMPYIESRGSSEKMDSSPVKGLKQRIAPEAPRSLRVLAQYLRWLVLNRPAIVRSRGTGYRISERYAKGALVSHECVTPVFRPQADFLGPGGRFLEINQRVEKILPDHLCYIPKRKESYSSEGFRELGYPDVSGMGWEEFLWQGRPFGFHIRRYPKEGIELEKQTELLPGILAQWIELASRSGNSEPLRVTSAGPGILT